MQRCHCVGSKLPDKASCDVVTMNSQLKKFTIHNLHKTGTLHNLTYNSSCGQGHADCSAYWGFFEVFSMG